MDDGDNGFTLIELLVVISIIGLLSSILLVAVTNARKKARDVKRLADVAQIQKALEFYIDSHGQYPDGDMEIGAPPGGCWGYDTSERGTFISALTTDKIMSQAPHDPGGISGSGCITYGEYNYAYLRYDSSFCDACNGKHYYVLGINTMETSAQHHTAGPNYSTSPGFACGANNWNYSFDWVVGKCE